MKLLLKNYLKNTEGIINSWKYLNYNLTVTESILKQDFDNLIEEGLNSSDDEIFTFEDFIEFVKINTELEII